MKNSIKIISWNVNGIRAVIKKGFYDFVKEYQPDILCLQETKAHPEQVDLEMDELPVRFWNSAEKKGYSGTSIFLNEDPINSYNGINIDKHDNEGRVITLEFNDFFLVNVYTPNSKRDLARLDYRYNEWDVDFLNYVKDLEKNKPVIFCGDLNVAHKEIDLKNIDFTFLDGGHSYQTVINDLTILYESMKGKKKVILCDDYGKESYIPEVEKAINDFTKQNNLKLNLIENRFAEIIT